MRTAFRSAKDKDKDRDKDNEVGSGDATRMRRSPPAAAPAHPLHTLQQQAGNQAVQNLLHIGRIQAKLTISNPGDPEEQEADQVADHVMRAHTGSPITAPCSCAEGEENCEACRQKGAMIQRRADRAGVSDGIASGENPALASLHRESGQPLDAATRAFFEPRFGRDFGGVRVHAGEESHQAATGIHADAFTLGQDIYFATPKYAPNTDHGRRLLAHELAHVEQQVPSPREPVGNRSLRSNPRISAAHLQRQVPPDANAALEAQHREDQLRVVKVIGQTAWDKVRRGEKSLSTPGEHKSRDHELLLANSEEWIRSGLATLAVLTPTTDQSGVRDGEQRFFDPTVKYPNLGGSVNNTKEMEKGANGLRDGKDIFLFVTPGVDDRTLAETVIHEVQHVAGADRDDGPWNEKQRQAIQAEQKGTDASAKSQIYETRWEKYEDEFRAFWLGSTPHAIRPYAPWQPDEDDRFGSDSKPGGELKVTGHPELKDDPNCLPEASLQLMNEKQTNIARLLLENYKGRGFDVAFLCSQIFRQRLLNLDHGQSVNFVNSVRIERLRHAMQSGTHQTLWGTDPQPAAIAFSVSQAVKHLDEADLLFLRDPASSGPFWNEARSLLTAPLYQWMEDYILRSKTDVPPPEPSTGGTVPPPVVPAQGGGT
jgi:hypothetical protein